MSEISLKISKGVVFGLLGPNGAGKSTLVKSLLTIVRPDVCRGRLLGRPIGKKQSLSQVGYLPEHAHFPEYLTGRQVVEMMAGLAKIPRRAAREQAGRLLNQVGMEDRADQPLRTYSKGMKQRIGLAQALVNDPQLVFLDEPTDGVDPGGRVEIRRMIEDLRTEGRTVFVNSHLLGEVEEIADEVAILSRGRIVVSGRTADLTNRGNRFAVRTMGPVPFDLRDGFEAEGMTVAGDLVELSSQDAAAVQPVIDCLRARQVSIREIREIHQSLEQVFLDAVRSQGREVP